jgi:hypothetical protein
MATSQAISPILARSIGLHDPLGKFIISMACIGTVYDVLAKRSPLATGIQGLICPFTDIGALAWALAAELSHGL